MKIKKTRFVGRLLICLILGFILAWPPNLMVSAQDANDSFDQMLAQLREEFFIPTSACSSRFHVNQMRCIPRSQRWTYLFFSSSG